MPGILSPAVISLIIANSVTLFGVFFYGWSIENIILIYWFESVVVGVYTVAKMLVVRSVIPSDPKLTQIAPRFPVWIAPIASVVFRLLSIGFFVFHFGFFTAMQGIFVSAIADHRMMGVLPFETSFFLSHKRDILMAVSCLVFSHGVSFLQNYIFRGEYARVTLGQVMSQPYARVGLMQIVLVFGTFAAVAFQQETLPFLIILVVGKMWIDIIAHVREHRRISAFEPPVVNVGPILQRFLRLCSRNVD